jgi:glycogen debranching enzyme
MEQPRSHNSDPDSSTDEQELDFKTLFSQHLEAVEYIPHTRAGFAPSAVKALIDLANVQKSDQIGLNGPPLAAGSSESNKHLEAFGAYQEFYPRDALKVSELLWFKYPELTKTTVLACLRYTGTVDNLPNATWLDEQEVGKIPHQVRDPEHPRSKRQFELRGRGYPFYGAIDTTQKNVRAITRISLDDTPQSLSFLNEQYSDLQGQRHTVAEGLRSNVGWIVNRLAFNPEGLMESIQVNPRHHANQSWADSPDSFHHADGTLARHHPEKNLGVASVEVNAETYDAIIAAIRTYTAMLPSLDSSERESLEADIESLELTAATLKQIVHALFWVEDENLYGGYFARGTDRDSNGNIRPLKIRSSDMGHLLLSDIVDDDDPKIISIIRNLFSPEMLAPNGIRTLSNDSVRYYKDAYHNGTVWPWDTYTIALGLEKRGYYRLAEELENRIMDFYKSTNTLAEYGSGDDTERINLTQKVTIFDPDLNEEPIEQYSVYDIVQPPQEIQAWTVAVVLAIKYKRADRALKAHLQPTREVDPEKREIESEILSGIQSAA